MGSDRVQRRDVHIGEGFCAPGSIVDAGRPNELEVVWEDSSRARPAAISVRRRGSEWRTPSGVRIGSTLAEMEEIAGQPIGFMGFGWDYGGRGGWTFDSPEGSGPVEFDLAPDSASAELARLDPRYGEISGDREVSSDDPLVRSMTIRVERLAIRSGESRAQFECAG